MRAHRRFQPAVDCLQVRIAPSTFTVTPPAATPAPVLVTMMDDTGSPGNLPSGNGSYPVIMTGPGGGSPTGNVC
jgi:hypothetical protein